MNTTKLPYELLIRWDQIGNLSGAHIQYRYVTHDDAGKIIGEFVSNAEALDTNTAKGFPLHEILSDTLKTALINNNELKQEHELVKQERDRLANEVHSLKKDRTDDA